MARLRRAALVALLLAGLATQTNAASLPPALSNVTARSSLGFYPQPHGMSLVTATTCGAWSYGWLTQTIQSSPAWSASTYATFRFNRCTVQLTSSTPSRYGYGFQVTFDWNGAWNSGLPYGGTSMDVGFNITVSALWNGFPIQRTFWSRRWVSRYGSVGPQRWGGA